MAADTVQDILLRIGITGDKSVDELRKKNTELLKSVLDNQKEIDNLSKSTKELSKAEGDNSEAIAQNILKQKELQAANKVNQNQINQNISLIGSEMGSLVEKRSQLSNMTLEYTRMSEAEKADIEIGGRLQKSIKSLSDELKAEEKQIGQTQRSVGDYTDSIIDASNKTEFTVKGVGELRKELIALRNTSLAGKTQEEIQAINIAIGNITDQLGDLKSMQKALGEDLGTNIAGSLQVVSASVEGVAASLALFGVGEENIAMVQKNITALIAVTQALGVIEEAMAKRTIQNTALRLKMAINNGIDTVSKWANTTATVAATNAEAARAVVMGQASIATKAAATVQWLWNTAIMANPIGAIIIGVLALTAGILALTGAFNSQNDSLIEAKINTKELADITKDYTEQVTGLQLDLLLKQKKINQQQFDDAKISMKKIKEEKALNIAAMKLEEEAYANWKKDLDDRTNWLGHLSEEDKKQAAMQYAADQRKIAEDLAKGMSAIDAKFSAEATNKTVENNEKKAADEKKSAEERLKKKIELEQKTLDILTSLIKDNREREEQQLFIAYDREYKAAKGSKELQHALNLKYAQESEAIQKKYSDEAIKQAQDAAEKKFEIDTKSAEKAKELKAKLIADQQLEFQNKIAQMQLDGQSTLQVELENETARGAALQAKDFETQALFIAAKLDSANKIKDINEKIIENEMAAANAKIAIAQSFHSGLNSLMEIFGANEEENAGFAKALAGFQIGIDTAVGISGAIKAGAGLVFPANLGAILMGVTSVLAGIASAKKALSSAGALPKAPKPQSFSTGGSVFGPGSGTSDSIPAYLSNGESVNNSLSSAMFAPLYSALNRAGGGAPIQSVNKSAEVYGEQFLANAFAQALKEMPSPVVAVEEITRVNNRVKVIESMSRQ
ncbi:MAG: hypothetical protein ACOYOV_05155 [Bacteroidales bacterium]